MRYESNTRILERMSERVCRGCAVKGQEERVVAEHIARSDEWVVRANVTSLLVSSERETMSGVPALVGSYNDKKLIEFT